MESLIKFKKLMEISFIQNQIFYIIRRLDIFQFFNDYIHELGVINFSPLFTHLLYVFYYLLLA